MGSDPQHLAQGEPGRQRAPGGHRWHLGFGLVFVAVWTAFSTWTMAYSAGDDNGLGLASVLVAILALFVVVPVIGFGAVLLSLNAARSRRATRWVGSQTALTAVIFPAVLALMLIPMTSDSAQAAIRAVGLAALIVVWFGWDRWKRSRGLKVDVRDPEAPLASRRLEINKLYPAGVSPTEGSSVWMVLPHDPAALEGWILGEAAPDNAEKPNRWRRLKYEVALTRRALRWRPTVLAILITVVAGNGGLLVALCWFGEPRDATYKIAVLTLMGTAQLVLITLIAVSADVMTGVRRRVQLRKVRAEIHEAETSRPISRAEARKLAAGVRESLHTVNRRRSARAYPRSLRRSRTGQARRDESS